MGVLNVIHGLPAPPTRSCATFLLMLGRASHANDFSALQMYGFCFFTPIGMHFMDPSLRVNVGHEFSINPHLNLRNCSTQHVFSYTSISSVSDIADAFPAEIGRFIHDI